MIDAFPPFSIPIRQRPVAEIVQQAAEQIHTSSIRQQATDEIFQQDAEELIMPEIFGQIPWFHHVEIFTKCKSLDEALFYINKVVKEGSLARA